MTDEQHLNRLRRLRVLQALYRRHPMPMGETALLDVVRADPELSPTIERVRQSLRYLGEQNLVEIITVDGSDWMAAHLAPVGRDLLAAKNDAWECFDIYHPTEKPEPAARSNRGRNSSIIALPVDAKAWLDQELVRRNFTGYVELAELLAQQGYEISKSAVGRYGKKFKEEQRELRQSIEMAKAFAEVVGDDGAAMNQTLTVLAQQELMAVIRNKDYSEAIKLPELVRSIASLNRSDVNTRKFQIEQAARHKALNDAANAVETAASEQGLSAEQAQFWREKVLGVQ